MTGLVEKPWVRCERGDYADYDGECVVFLTKDQDRRVCVVFRDEDADEIERLQSRIEALEAAVKEARLQIQYLHEKFGETGSGNSVLAKLDALTEREKG